MKRLHINRSALGALAAVFALPLVANCGPSSERTTITVLAAASLSSTFPALGREFEATHPHTHVVFSFGGSSALAASVVRGAPADVFAAASAKTMQTVVDAKYASRPVPFATNVLEIAVPPGNPGHVASIGDLAKPDVKVALCQSAVPCGVVASTVLHKAGVSVTPVTQEPDVNGVLTKVKSGAVDAGLVYVTDVKAAGTSVTGVAIDSAVNASTTYPIAVLTHSKKGREAQEFADYVASAEGQRTLAAAGFAKP